MFDKFSPERKLARRYDTPYRSRDVTDQVYEGEVPADIRPEVVKNFYNFCSKMYPDAPEYNVYYGELHGHSCLSDGRPTPDEYYKHLRDVAKFDFGVLSDHTHGGVGKATLFGEAFEPLREAAKKYNEPGKFSTMLSYEIECYPYYNNMVVYHKNFDDPVIASEVLGDFTHDEMKAMLERDDLVAVPHDTYHLEAGADLSTMPEELFSPLIQLYSRGNSAEYFGNPQFDWFDTFMCEGGFWHDALRRGAKMGCIGASDDHGLTNGMINENIPGLGKYPGITGVLAKENTTEAIFEALKARRCYCFMGGRINMDFRINGHYMGEEFLSGDDRQIYFKVQADGEIDHITIVKNCRDYIRTRKSEYIMLDYKQEQDTDYYYLRVQLKDGRCGWTSPIWITKP